MSERPMTPDQAAQFVLSDCQDPELRKLADAEFEAQFAEWMKDPESKAVWDARVKAIADDVDREAAAYVHDRLRREK